MAYYIKVTQQVCKKLGHGIDRNDTADQNKLLWQADIDNVEGETVYDRAAIVGGVCLDAWAAKAEIDGVENPAEVYTPDAYKDPEPTPEETPTEGPAEAPAEGQVENPSESPSDNSTADPAEKPTDESAEDASLKSEAKAEGQEVAQNEGGETA